MISGMVGRSNPCPCGSGKKYKKCCELRGGTALPAPQGDPAGEGWRSRGLSALLFLLILAATAGVYWPMGRHGFISLDDPQFVPENPLVKAGLTAAGLRWALTTFLSGNWYPLTWLSHMLDCQLFGPNAGAHHLVSAGLHAASAGLLFLALARMTRRPWRSALVAGIFALHPLHVESVAWIAERKDVLSGFFAMATLWFYARYAEAPRVGRSLAVMTAFALGLMSKPMLVSIPAVLLLLDFWPLQRFSWPPKWPGVKGLVMEKWPLFAMAAATSAQTLRVQGSAGATHTLMDVSMDARLANAAMGYASYISKAFWPVNLAVLYPLHKEPRYAGGWGALLILVILSVAAWRAASRKPYLLVGWLWFVGMLVPVIGLVQVGNQSIADRYTYLPLIGLSLAVVWGVSDVLASRRLQFLAFPLGITALLFLGGATYRQVAYWRDTRTLFEHALAVTQRNFIIQNNLGVFLEEEGNSDEAIGHYREALAISPRYAEAHNNLGAALAPQGHLDEAIIHFRETLRLNPRFLDARYNLGMALAAQGKKAEAEDELSRVIAVAPGHAGARRLLEQLPDNPISRPQRHPPRSQAGDPSSVKQICLRT